MGVVTFFLLGLCALNTMAFLPSGKEHMVSESLLREVVDRMGRDLDSYLEEVGVANGQLNLGPRADKDMEDGYFQDSPPSIRDQEYLQHSTLWANRFMQGDEGESRMRINQAGGSHKSRLKPDTALPAYCNPPNPCPVGYTESEGCLEEFENTAAFSREFQAQQECMCDSEHMFDCSNMAQHDISDLMPTFQVEDEHKNLVAKKFHVDNDWNPYLLGEKLPVAAKKGQNVLMF